VTLIQQITLLTVTLIQQITLLTVTLKQVIFFSFPERKKWPRYQRVISLQTQVGITSQRSKWANTDSGHTGGGIRCLGGVSIPCRVITPAMGPISNVKIRTLNKTCLPSFNTLCVSEM
jgi:hypothetical protein